MVIIKDRLQNIVDGLPQTVDIQSDVDESILLDKVEKARHEIEKGKCFSEEELDKEIDLWH